MSYTRKDVEEIDMMKKQLEELAVIKKAKILGGGWDNPIVDKLYKEICDKVKQLQY